MKKTNMTHPSLIENVEKDFNESEVVKEVKVMEAIAFAHGYPAYHGKTLQEELHIALSSLTHAIEAKIPKEKHYKVMYSEEAQGFDRESFAGGFNQCRKEVLTILATLKDFN